MAKYCRKPDIMADAAYAILCRENCAGNFFIDEHVVVEEGVEDLGRYAAVAGTRSEEMVDLVTLGVSWENIARAFQRNVAGK